MTKPSSFFLLFLIGLGGCGGGDGEAIILAEAEAVFDQASTDNANQSCSPDCALSAADVERIIGQAVAEAELLQVGATISVSDRVGNILGVYQMASADPFVTVTSTKDFGAPIVGGLENLNFIPASLAAIAKSITGAYLSTSGNAFTTRTASQIVQENFNPGEADVPSGPLFGVQFSQLPCSDFSSRFSGSNNSPGPHRSPLGLAADPGGMPLYKDGINVGGVGVSADGIYGLDKFIGDFDIDIDEIIATAATVGFAAPLDIRADQITLVGKTARYSDTFVSDLQSSPEDRKNLSQLTLDGVGSFVSVPGYFDGGNVKGGTVFGLANSGIRPADPSIFKDEAGESLDAFVFVDEQNRNRYAARDGSDRPGGIEGNRLTSEEVQILLNEAIGIANKSRAQIRVPVGTPARVTVTVVDTNGAIVGMARTRDGPVFGADVSIQKARTATFFSGSGRKDGGAPAEILRALPDPTYLEPIQGEIAISKLGVLETPAPKLGDYILAVQNFLGDPLALERDGQVVAFADRSGGNLSRPNYPDGPKDGPPGPLSKPPGEWSVFSVGLQLDLVYNAIINHVASILGAAPEGPQVCTGNTGFSASEPFQQANSFQNIANGIQIFPGSVPIFRGDTLIGGIGVSGDGVDQDDMISFLGVHQAGLRVGNGLGNAPPELRADRLEIPGQQVRLRYVNCPQVPFIGSAETEVCNGL